MKKISFCVLLAMSSTICFSQLKKQPEPQKSNLETYSEKSGLLFKKSIINVGKFNETTFASMQLTDVATGSKINGLRLEMKSSNEYIGENIVFIDSDELESLLKTIDYLSSNVTNKPLPTNYVEYNFRARSGFRFGVFKHSDSEWGAYFQLNSTDDSSEVFLKSAELSQLKDLILKAKANF